MANKVLTITEPALNSQGVRIQIERDASGIRVDVRYENQGSISLGAFRDTDLTAAQQTTLNNLITAIINKAKVQMGF